MPASDPRSPWWRHLFALLILLACGFGLWTSEQRWSPTSDEPVHLMRGHAFWWTGSAKLSSAHPPLANAITSLPWALDGDDPWALAGKPTRPGDPQTKRESVLLNKGWVDANPLPIAMGYFSHDYASVRAELSGARRVMMVWTLIFAATLYLWCERRWGFATGILALILAATHPTLLAHGQLVTTDLPAAATTFWLIAAWIAWLERPSAWRVVLFGVAACAVLLTKHSGLVLIVLAAAVLVAAAWFGWGGFAVDRRARARWRQTAMVGLQLLGVAIATLVVLAAVYRFDRVGMSVAEILAEPEPRSWIAKRQKFAMFDHTPLAYLPGWLRLPLPYDWLAGLATVAAQNELGHGGYFFGPRDQPSHWAYFPVLLVIKTPLGLLGLLGLALGLVVTRRSLSLASRALLLVVVVTLVGACASRINIGVRHVLPVVPILIVFAARAGALAWTWGARWARALVLACVLGNLAGVVSSHPHWLSDFNLLVGGEPGGLEVSVIGEDWGQDVVDLAELGRRLGWKRVRYATIFMPRRLELQQAGIKAIRHKCGKEYRGPDPVVVHLSDWVRKRGCFRWLEGEPDYVVNHHILVFLGPHDRA